MSASRTLYRRSRNWQNKRELGSKPGTPARHLRPADAWPTGIPHPRFQGQELRFDELGLIAELHTTKGLRVRRDPAA